MYKAVIEAHDLKKIRTESYEMGVISDIDIVHLLQNTRVFLISADRDKVLDGFSITVTITKTEK